MIQPLRTTREVWILNWADVPTPVQFGVVYLLPTILYVTQRKSRAILAHEVVREIDQHRVELFLDRLFQTKGVPDELLVPETDDWNEDFWPFLAREYGFQVHLVGSTKQPVSESSPALSLSFPGMRKPDMPADPPETIARGLVLAIRYFQSPEKRRALLAKALELAPDFPEALLESADIELQEGNLEKADEGFRAALRAATPNSTEVHIRARHGRLLVAWQQGQIAEAIALARDALATNPTDHAGARFILPLLLLLNQQTEQVSEFFEWYAERYPDDLEDPGLLFAWGFSEFESDRDRRSQVHYLNGMLQNLYLGPLLLDQPEPSPDIWQHHERGEIVYARDFLESFGSVWEQRPGSIRFLRELYQTHLAKFEEMISLRRQMAALQDNRYEPRHHEIWESLMAAERTLIAACKEKI